VTALAPSSFFEDVNMVGGLLSAVIVAAVVIAALLLLTWVAGVRRIPSDKVGVVEKWWSPKGSLKDSIISLGGEAGYQPYVLRGGLHLRTPLMYKVHVMPLVTIARARSATSSPGTVRRCPPGRPSVGSCRPTPSRTSGRSSPAVANAARSARSCGKARTRSTWPSSS
jgi:hypothetical protein